MKNAKPLKADRQQLKSLGQGRHDMKRFSISVAVLVLALVAPVQTLEQISNAQAEQQVRELEFLIVTPEDINRLCWVAIERGEEPSPEGQLYLEFKSGGFRQYVTLALTRELFGGFVTVERVDFIQEQWQVNVFEQNEIDQWLISANANGMARSVRHKRLLEDKGTVLKEEFLPTDEDSTKAIVGEIVVRFLRASFVAGELA